MSTQINDLPASVAHWLDEYKRLLLDAFVESLALKQEAHAPHSLMNASTLTTNQRIRGNIMSTEINLEMIDLDPAASAFLAAYIEAKVKIKEWQEKADIAAEQVKAAMGEHEIGLVNGREAVRWTTVEATRIDSTKVRNLLDSETLAKVETTSVSRRFSIVDEE